MQTVQHRPNFTGAPKEPWKRQTCCEIRVGLCSDYHIIIMSSVMGSLETLIVLRQYLYCLGLEFTLSLVRFWENAHGNNVFNICTATNPLHYIAL